MSRLSVNQLTTVRWYLDDDVREFQAAGFEGVGLWREKLTDYSLAEARELLSASGLAVSSLSWAGGFTGTDGRSHADAIDDAIEAIELAALVEAECLIVHSGARGTHTQKHARRLLHTALVELLPCAEALNVRLALEPMHAGVAGGWTFLTKLHETLSTIRSFESQHVGLVLDAYHMLHDQHLLQQLPSLVPHLALVQLGDARGVPCGDPNRCPLGAGELPLAQLVTSLAELGYQGFFEVELQGEDVEQLEYRELLDHSRQVVEEWLAMTPFR
jgi:sugar phosphate isomerase/epimerase